MTTTHIFLHKPDEKTLRVLANFADHLESILVEVGSLLFDSVKGEVGSRSSGELPRFMMARKLLDLLASSVPMVRQGRIGAGDALARVMLEASVYLELLSRAGPEAGYGYKAHSVLQDIKALRSLDPTSPLEDKIRKGAKNQGLRFVDRLDVDKIRQELRDKEELLETAEYKAAIERLDALGKKNPSWYAPYSDGASSLEQLTAFLSRDGEYEGIYRSLSKDIHSSRVHIDGLLVSEGGANIRPIGAPLGVESLTQMLGTFALQVARSLESELDGGRLTMFREWFAGSPMEFRKRLSDGPILVAR